MGKKRIISKGEGEEGAAKAVSASSKRRIEHGVLFVNSTYNNTLVSLLDGEGRVILWSSSGSLGYKGAKKGTPFAAGKVGELLADKAMALGLKEIDVVIKGVGAGRESSIRSFASKGIVINSIKDKTPSRWGGCKPKKPRRI